MEDRIIALTPWVMALMFELLGIAALVLALIHFSWPDMLYLGLLINALARTLPPVLRRLRTAWKAPSLPRGRLARLVGWVSAALPITQPRTPPRHREAAKRPRQSIFSVAPPIGQRQNPYAPSSGPAMENTIITLTPAATQFGIIIFLAATQFIEYRQTGRIGYLVLTAILCLFLPFCLHRLRTSWRNRALPAA